MHLCGWPATTLMSWQARDIAFLHQAPRLHDADDYLYICDRLGDQCSVLTIFICCWVQDEAEDQMRDQQQCQWLSDVRMTVPVVEFCHFAGGSGVPWTRVENEWTQWKDDIGTTGLIDCSCSVELRECYGLHLRTEDAASAGRIRKAGDSRGRRRARFR